jgi:N-glycosyltransferase
MRLLLTTQALTSHLRAMIPFAYAARRAGHEVTVAAPRTVASEVRGYGLDHLPAGVDCRLVLQPHIAAEEVPDRKSRPHAPREIFAGQMARPMVEDLLDALGDAPPDLVVRESAEFGGYLAAELLGIPHASLAVAGGTALLFDHALLGPSLAAHRSAFGLPADHEGTAPYRFLHANFMPPEYDPAEMRIATTRCYRQSNPERPGERLPSWIGELNPDRRLVFVSLGTVASELPPDALLTKVLAALADLEVSVIVVGAAGVENLSLPPHIHLAGYLPQPLLLECCDLFVTHGGFNSVREALRLGLPMVMVPVLADQPYNARRCEALGVARVVPAFTATVPMIREACIEVLEDARFRRRASALRQRMLTLPPLDALVTDLEFLAAGGMLSADHGCLERTGNPR